MRILQRITLASLAACGLAGTSLGQPVDRAQRGCVVELNRRAAAVFETQAKEATRCLSRGAKGKEPDAQACLVGDPRGKVQKGLGKLSSGAAKKCSDPLPPFGYGDATAVGDAAELEARQLFEDLYGSDLAAAAAGARSKPDAACLAEVAKREVKLTSALFKLANSAKDRALAGKNQPAAASAQELADAILSALAADEKGKLARAEAKLASKAEKKCDGTDLAPLFPGRCGGVTTAAELASCAAQRASCRFCQSLATFDTLPIDCDAFDDGASNASCLDFTAPIVPGLLSSDPADGSADVAPHTWIELLFDAPVPATITSELELSCDGSPRALRVEASSGDVVFAIPETTLPPGASCALAWPVIGELTHFTTGAVTPVVLYDRTDPLLISPVPDDYFLVDDATTASGKRIGWVAPPFSDLLLLVAEGIAEAISTRDGHSPLSSFTLLFSHEADSATVPLGPADSLAPDASIRIYDLDPASPSFGERIPFHTTLRSDPAGGGETDHGALLFTELNLRAGGRYALVVTRAASALGGLAFGPSAFFERVLDPAAPAPAEVARARLSTGPVLDFLANDASPGLVAADVALAVSISVRSQFGDPSDWVSVKEQLVAGPPPVPDVASIQALANEAVHRGTMPLPLWVADPSLTQVTRNAATGEPTSLGTDPVPFVLRVPTGVPTPVPILIMQHGGGGSAEDVTLPHFQPLLEAGYALVAITDVTHRRFGQDPEPQQTEIIGRLAFGDGLPLVNFQTNADMLALVRAIEGMGVAGNFPEIDPTRILFQGISGGANNSMGFLPFAPEVVAAVSHVGGGRLFQSNLHQLDLDDGLQNILDALPGSRPRDVIAGMALVHNEQDQDDGMLLVRHLYRDALPIEGVGDTTPPSLLWIEGIGDTRIPNAATRAAAVEFGVPTVRPISGPSTVLTEVDAPLTENMAPGVTAGHFQYDPAQTPWCVAFGETEGHFCAQDADEVWTQLLHFFDTALAGSAEIIDPFPP